MDKKRLVLDLGASQHAMLVKKARAADLTLSNYVRKALGLPPEHQGKPSKRQSTKAAAKPRAVKES
jgi:hypothetical protein